MSFGIAPKAQVKPNAKIYYGVPLKLDRVVWFFLPLLIVFLVNPKPAVASIASLLGGFLGNMAGAATAETATGNSQNMALLQAALNNDPNPDKGDSGDSVIEGNALMANSGPAGGLADMASSTPGSDRISTYVVRKGDTLSEIAQMFNVSVNTIRWINDIKKSSVIKVGQTLIILPISGVQYTIKKGDTLTGIVKKFGGDEEEILAYNNLDSTNDLAVGDTIIIPDGDASPPTTGTNSGRGTATASRPNYQGYYLRPLVGGIKTQGLHGYNGIDVSTPTGSSVMASAAGKVIIAKGSGWSGGYGQYIVVQHNNGTQTLYAHLSQVNVVPSETVERGQVIAYSGNSGRSTGPHLHFEIRGAKNPF
ncbi:MAG: M23 family metallopeptidase [Patescibacteria group bacterium]